MAKQVQDLDKAQVIAAFDKAAHSYDAVSLLQREIGQRLFDRLQAIRFTPSYIVDVGAGTGHFSLALSQHFPQARLVCLDIAPAMLAQAKTKVSVTNVDFLCADAEQLPLAAASVDFVFANLSLQWVNELGQCFVEIFRVLKPHGLLLFSTFGPDTLTELRQSWAQVDTNPHVHSFYDMHDIGDALLAAGLIDPVMDMQHITMTYPDVQKLLADLKALGAHNANTQRCKNMTGKTKWRAMVQAYEKFRRADGLLPATYEAVYGHAWGGGSRRNAQAVVPISAIKRSS